jgi:hypothetical protein
MEFRWKVSMRKGYMSNFFIGGRRREFEEVFAGQQGRPAEKSLLIG